MERVQCPFQDDWKLKGSVTQAIAFILLAKFSVILKQIHAADNFIKTDKNFLFSSKLFRSSIFYDSPIDFD
jgi:hypothetical protein